MNKNILISIDKFTSDLIKKNSVLTFKSIEFKSVKASESELSVFFLISAS